MLLVWKSLNICSASHYKWLSLKLEIIYTSRLYPEKRDVTSLSHWAAPVDTYTPYDKAIQQDFTPSRIGDTFGPT